MAEQPGNFAQGFISVRVIGGFQDLQGFYDIALLCPGEIGLVQ